MKSFDVHPRRSPQTVLWAALAALAVTQTVFPAQRAFGQQTEPPAADAADQRPTKWETPRRTTKSTFDELVPSAKTEQKLKDLIGDVIEPEAPLTIDPRRSKLIRTKQAVTRFSVTDPAVLEVVQFGPTEFELIGGAVGETTLTLWFADGEILRYYVRVERADKIQKTIETEYGNLQRKINEMFPNSMIQLIPIGYKELGRGQAGGD
jgi:pilus assembly protein CpaC